MEKINLAKQLTHHYVGTYSHLDKWRDVGTAVLTPEKVVREGESFDDGGTYIRWATLPRGQNRDASVRALVDSLSRHGCAHEWDCCGCASWSTRVLHRHGRRVVLKTTVSFNY
jgi:hypothetical protein